MTTIDCVSCTYTNMQEVDAVTTISQQGVGMICTAYGDDRSSLLQNPILVDLLGGVQVK